jgi:hypothetical protein
LTVVMLNSLLLFLFCSLAWSQAGQDEKRTASRLLPALLTEGDLSPDWRIKSLMQLSPGGEISVGGEIVSLRLERVTDGRGLSLYVRLHPTARQALDSITPGLGAHAPTSLGSFTGRPVGQQSYHQNHALRAFQGKTTIEVSLVTEDKADRQIQESIALTALEKLAKAGLAVPAPDSEFPPPPLAKVDATVLLPSDADLPGFANIRREGTRINWTYPRDRFLPLYGRNASLTAYRPQDKGAMSVNVGVGRTDSRFREIASGSSGAPRIWRTPQGRNSYIAAEYGTLRINIKFYYSEPSRYEESPSEVDWQMLENLVRDILKRAEGRPEMQPFLHPAPVPTTDFPTGRRILPILA